MVHTEELSPCCCAKLRYHNGEYSCSECGITYSADMFKRTNVKGLLKNHELMVNRYQDTFYKKR